MTSHPLRTRVIGCIELLDPAAPAEIWEKLASGPTRDSESGSLSESGGDARSNQARIAHRSQERCTAVAADVVQLRGDLDDEFRRLRLRFLGAPTHFRPGSE